VFSTVRVIRPHPSPAVINDHENGRKNGAPIVRSDKAKSLVRRASINNGTTLMKSPLLPYSAVAIERGTLTTRDSLLSFNRLITRKTDDRKGNEVARQHVAYDKAIFHVSQISFPDRFFYDSSLPNSPVIRRSLISARYRAVEPCR
jgi:hypothetical protein